MDSPGIPRDSKSNPKQMLQFWSTKGAQLAFERNPKFDAAQYYEKYGAQVTPRESKLVSDICAQFPMGVPCFLERSFYKCINLSKISA